MTDSNKVRNPVWLSPWKPVVAISSSLLILVGLVVGFTFGVRPDDGEGSELFDVASVLSFGTLLALVIFAMRSVALVSQLIELWSFDRAPLEDKTSLADRLNLVVLPIAAILVSIALGFSDKIADRQIWVLAVVGIVFAAGLIYWQYARIVNDEQTSPSLRLFPASYEAYTQEEFSRFLEEEKRKRSKCKSTAFFGEPRYLKEREDALEKILDNKEFGQMSRRGVQVQGIIYIPGMALVVGVITTSALMETAPVWLRALQVIGLVVLCLIVGTTTKSSLDQVAVYEQRRAFAWVEADKMYRQYLKNRGLQPHPLTRQQVEEIVALENQKLLLSIQRMFETHKPQHDE